MNPDAEDREVPESVDLRIVENLRRAYDQTLTEAVPDRFLELLRKLKEAEDSGAGSEQ